MKPNYGYDDLLIGFSVVAVIFAAIGFWGYDIGLASTQWMLVSIVLGLWGIYFRLATKK